VDLGIVWSSLIGSFFVTFLLYTRFGLIGVTGSLLSIVSSSVLHRSDSWRHFFVWRGSLTGVTRRKGEDLGDGGSEWIEWIECMEWMESLSLDWLSFNSIGGIVEIKGVMEDWEVIVLDFVVMDAVTLLFANVLVDFGDVVDGVFDVNDLLWQNLGS
jgi:hypothetical protein